MSVARKYALIEQSNNEQMNEQTKKKLNEKLKDVMLMMDIYLSCSILFMVQK